MINGTMLITIERARQISQEGWTAEHDDSHVNGELLEGCLPLLLRWKPCHTGGTITLEDPIRMLTKAGALIAAEIDRLQR